MLLCVMDWPECTIERYLLQIVIWTFNCRHVSNSTTEIELIPSLPGAHTVTPSSQTMLSGPAVDHSAALQCCAIFVDDLKQGREDVSKTLKVSHSDMAALGKSALCILARNNTPLSEWIQ